MILKRKASKTLLVGGLAALFLFALAQGGRAETIDELYQKAKKEEGVLNCYCSLAQINAEKIYPVFEKRFPGIKINHVDALSLIHISEPTRLLSISYAV